MKKTIILTLLAVLLGGFSFASEFTVDDRSMLHVGASAFITASCNAFVTSTQGKTTNAQRLFCASTAFGVGLFKEYMVDAHPDYGDIFFNAVGIAVTDRVFIHFFPVDNGGGLSVTSRW